MIARKTGKASEEEPWKPRPFATKAACYNTNFLSGGCSSDGRAPPLHGGGQGFESPQLHHHWSLHCDSLHAPVHFVCRIWYPQSPSNKAAVDGAHRYVRCIRWGKTTMADSFNARYTHTNLVARDWRLLAGFYQRVFDCLPIPPERDISGEWLSRATGVPDAALRGVHLRLPGYGDSGPTLEIFQYSRVLDAPVSAANRQGYGHVAFAVDDVAGAVESVVSNGGRLIGEVVKRTVPGVGVLVFAYAADPEDNIIELQRWSHEPSSALSEDS